MDDVTLNFWVSLDSLDENQAKFFNEQNQVRFSIPRGSWESFGRPSSIKISVTEEPLPGRDN